MANKTQIGILISGRGSNMVAIADSIDAGRISNAEIAVVISNKAETKGIEVARKRELQTAVLTTKGLPRRSQEREVLAVLEAMEVNLVCLAGYMRILSPEFVRCFRNRILNIHPSLLPAFPGENAHRDVLAYGAKVSGCTVHIVDEEVDHGPIVVQKSVPVLNDDNEDTLAARVLVQEHIAYTEAINMVLSCDYQVVDRRCVRR
jgi:phosphoribosylglycinamide formyltransferase-1